MFRCANGHISKPGEKQILFITKKRIREYPNGSIGWEIAATEQRCQLHKDYNNA